MRTLLKSVLKRLKEEARSQREASKQPVHLGIAQGIEYAIAELEEQIRKVETAAK